MPGHVCKAGNRTPRIIIIILIAFGNYEHRPVFIIFWLWTGADKVCVIYTDDGIKRWILEHQVKELADDGKSVITHMLLPYISGLV